MLLNQRPKTLVISSLLILSGLTAVQLFMLRNTYRLNVYNYRNEVKDAIVKLQTDSTYNNLLKDLRENLAECSRKLVTGEIDRNEFITQLTKKEQKVVRQLDSSMFYHAKTCPLLKDVNELPTFTSIVITKGTQRLVPVTRSTPLRLAEPSRNKYKVIFKMGEGVGNMERGKNNELRIDFTYLREFEVPLLPPTVSQQLILIGTLSLVLLCAVVVAFYFTIRSAQKQRKIAELKTDLVNNISHELKTPLSSMSVALKTLAIPLISSDAVKSKEILAAVARQHNKLNQTVERILESAMSRDVVNQETFNITEFLNQYQSNLLIDSHSVSLDVEPSSVVVIGIKEIVEASLDNLIENARKYSALGSLIHIKGRQDDNRYRIDVVDAGSGISKKDQSSLFEKFYRVPGNSHHTVNGLGLGLFLSREGVRRLGGEVQLTSSGASGSIFTIYLLLV